MNTREHETMKNAGSGDISYLGAGGRHMIYDFMQEHGSPGLRLPLYGGAVYPAGGWIRNVR